jgi:RNase P subunit RPR2
MAQKPRVLLSVKRAIEMERVHPQTDFRHVCSSCHTPVGIFPSGQRILREHKKRVIILCTRCQPSGWMPPAPGAEQERAETIAIHNKH